MMFIKLDYYEEEARSVNLTHSPSPVFRQAFFISVHFGSP